MIDLSFKFNDIKDIAEIRQWRSRIVNDHGLIPINDHAKWRRIIDLFANIFCDPRYEIDINNSYCVDVYHGLRVIQFVAAGLDHAIITESERQLHYLYTSIDGDVILTTSIDDADYLMALLSMVG